jgi:hypothetical protein
MGGVRHSVAVVQRSALARPSLAAPVRRAVFSWGMADAEGQGRSTDLGWKALSDQALWFVASASAHIGRPQPGQSRHYERRIGPPLG